MIDAEFKPSKSAISFARRFLLKARFALLLLFLLAPALAWAQQPQTITFTAFPFAPTYAGTSTVLAATATSGLPVTFSVVSGPAQVSGANGSILTLIGVGTVTVQADQAGGNGYSAAPSVQAPAVNVQLLTEPVTTPSAQVTTIVTLTATGTIGNVSALTQGAVNTDFIFDARGHVRAPMCTVGATYTAGQICYLVYRFTPTHPGIRYGGLTVTDTNGNLLGNSYVYGYGVGPQVLYAPQVQTLVGNSLGEPSGVAVDGAGDLFVSNYTGNSLTEITAAGAVVSLANVGSGRDVAVDGSGNVFFVTFDTLYEVTAVNGVIPASPILRTLATGFTVAGGGLAIDGAGNAYIANGPASSTKAQPAGVVYEVLAVGGVIPSNSPKQILGPLFAQPTGVAVDSSGNVYISDGTAPGIFEMLAVNGRVPASPTVVSLGTGLVAPSNIRLDNTNDIYISDAGVPGILEFQAVNASFPRPRRRCASAPASLARRACWSMAAATCSSPTAATRRSSSSTIPASQASPSPTPTWARPAATVPRPSPTPTPATLRSSSPPLPAAATRPSRRTSP